MTRRAQRENCLPEGALPLGLSRVQAAVFVGVSPTTFDQMVENGSMPKAFRVGSRAIWSRRRVEEYFAALDKEDAVDDAYARQEL